MADDLHYQPDAPDHKSVAHRKTPLKFGEQLEEKWPQITKALELPAELLQQIKNQSMEGKLQAVLEWLGERQGRKALASAILRTLPGEEDHWEQDVQNALNKAATPRVATPSTGYHSQYGLQMTGEYSSSLGSSGSSYEPTLSYSRRGLITGPLSGTQEKFLLWKCLPKERPRLCSAVCCGVFLFTLVIFLATAGLFTFAFYHVDESNTQLGFAGDTIVAKTASGFWYQSFKVVQAIQEGDNDHQIHVQTIPCKDLQIHDLGEYKSRILNVSMDTRMLAAMEYDYLPPGSTVHYNVCLSSNEISRGSAEFFVFDSLTAYTNFINEYDDGVDSSVLHQKVEVGMEGTSKCSSLEYTAEAWSYYFFSIQSSGGISAQYSISSDVKYLNWTDYPEGGGMSCTVGELHSCDLRFGHSFFGSLQDYCLLAYVIPVPPYLVESPTTHIHIETSKRNSVLVIPALLEVVGVVGLIGVLSCHCYMSFKHRSRNRNDYHALP